MKYLILCFLAFLLSACGDKGIDGKLDTSGSAQAFVKSFYEATVGATPEQKSVFSRRQIEVVGYSILVGAVNSKGFVSDAKSEEEFKKVSKMSLRELMVSKLEASQNELNREIAAIEDYINKKSLVVEDVSISEIKPKVVTPATSDISIDGVLTVRNDSEGFDYYFRGCHLALVVDGQAVEELHGHDDCDLKTKVVKGKGGKEFVKFTYQLRGNEKIKTFFDSLQESKLEKISWIFKQSKDSYIKESKEPSSIHKLDESSLAKDKADLEQVSADLIVIKKK